RVLTGRDAIEGVQGRLGTLLGCTTFFACLSLVVKCRRAGGGHPMLPDEVSRAELASLLELTGRHVDRVAKDGLVKRVREGWFELGASVQGFIKHRERIAEEKFGAGSYTDARTALTREKAMEARAARLEREGGLVPVLDLERAWTAVFAA